MLQIRIFRIIVSVPDVRVGQSCQHKHSRMNFSAVLGFIKEPVSDRRSKRRVRILRTIPPRQPS